MNEKLTKEWGLKTLVVPGGWFGRTRVFDASSVEKIGTPLSSQYRSCSCCCVEEGGTFFKTNSGEILYGYEG